MQKNDKQSNVIFYLERNGEIAVRLCRLVDLCDKEVVNIKTGNCLGCVCDVEFDVNCAKLTALIIYGKPKCFGLLGRTQDLIVRWNDIEVIGEDTILVSANQSCEHVRRKKRHNIFNMLFK